MITYNNIKLRDYQKNAVENILFCLQNTDLIPVLTEPPGSGKTIMATKIMEKMLELGYKRILFLCEGQSVLRLQNYIEILTTINPKYKIQILKSKYEFDPTANVIVTLPQTINSLKEKFDFLVVDEAHNRYLQKEMQEIIFNNNIKKQFLLTATPSCFLYENDKEYKYKLVGHTFLDLYSKSIELNETWFILLI